MNPSRQSSNLSAAALVASIAGLLLTAPAVYQGIRLLKEARPLTHTTALFRGTTIPCLVCALVGLTLGTRSRGGRFATAAVVIAIVALVAILLITLPQ